MAQSSVVVFDVNETLSDMSAMGFRFGDLGAPEAMASLWFASVLREGFAAAATGRLERFADLAAESLRVLLVAQSLDRPVDEAVEHVMAGFMRLPAHDDVAAGVPALRQAGLRLVTLSNGSTEVADQLLSTAGVRDDFERLLTVEDAGIWKPAAGAYEYAAQQCGTRPEEMVLVAAHPWDVDGASRAGMRTAWVNRSGARYPSYAADPDVVVGSLQELPEALS